MPNRGMNQQNQNQNQFSQQGSKFNEPRQSDRRGYFGPEHKQQSGNNNDRQNGNSNNNMNRGGKRMLVFNAIIHSFTALEIQTPVQTPDCCV